MVFSEEGQVTREVSWRAGEWSVFAPRAVSMDVRSGGSPFTVSAHTRLIPVQTLDAVGRVIGQIVTIVLQQCFSKLTVYICVMD